MTAPAIKFATHADSGGSWYCPKERRQVIEVIGENGKPRKPTLRDARKHGWLPGVTGVIRCAAAPGLERWKIGQAVMASLTLTRQPNEPDDAWIERILEDGQETGRKAAEAGTAIHAAVQRWFETRISPPDHESPYVEAVNATLVRCCGLMDWHAERLCFHRHYATKADLSATAPLDPDLTAPGTAWVLDMKSSDFDEQKQPDLKTYATHWMQLAATRAALAMDDIGFAQARCGILFVSRSHPGLVSLVEVTKPQLERGWGLFSALLTYWRIDRDYDPCASTS